MTFTAPVLSLGWLIALFVLVLAVVLKMVGLIDFPTALLISVVCAVRL